MDPESVAATAKHITSAADEVQTLHTTTSAALDSGGPGYVGNSAQELNQLSQRWAAAGQRHTEHLDKLGRGVRDAGVALSGTEERNAREIADVPKGLSR
jgi:WXG100 family type VII secretion target